MSGVGEFSFPYPVMGKVRRPKGHGCRHCVHSTYCPALYWFRRYGYEQPDEMSGVQCESWSDNRAEIVKEVTDRDMKENDYMDLQGIGSEANRSGITDAVTGTWRRP